jgi:putative transposase
MPRKLREELAGGVHHVYARGNDRRRIFVDDVDRHGYLALLGVVVASQRWRCLAYCLMDNHVHLLVETPEANLGAGMQRLHGTYGRDFNARHGRSGHVFQGRYGSMLVTADEHLWVAVAYIAANPVEAGVCSGVADWPWSSHTAILDGAAPPWVDLRRLLSYFAEAGGDPWRRYLAAVAERCGSGAA